MIVIAIFIIVLSVDAVVQCIFVAHH